MLFFSRSQVHDFFLFPVYMEISYAQIYTAHAFFLAHEYVNLFLYFLYTSISCLWKYRMQERRTRQLIYNPIYELYSFQICLKFRSLMIFNTLLHLVFLPLFDSRVPYNLQRQNVAYMTLILVSTPTLFRMVLLIKQTMSCVFKQDVKNKTHNIF